MNNIKSNYIYSCVYQILLIILPIITAPYVSRVLGADLLGQFTYVNTIAYYFVLFIMLGISNYGNRCIASSKNLEERNIYFKEIYSIQLKWGLLISIIYIIFIMLQKGEINIYIYIMQFLYVISAIFDVSWYFFGREQFKISVTRNIIIKFLAAVCVFVFVKNKNHLILYTAIIAGFTFLGQFALWIIAIKEEKFKLVKINSYKKHIKQIILLFIPVLAVSIYAYLSKIILGNISSMSELTYYEYAYKIVSAPLGIITALGTVMLPRMSNLYSREKIDEALSLIMKSFYFVSIISFPMCGGLVAIAGKFSVLFYGEEYLRCGYVMMILAFTIPFISWANVIRTQYLIPLKKDSVFIKSVLIGAVFNIIINIIIIPDLGAIGAAISTVVTEIVVCLYQMFIIRKELSFLNILKKQLIVLIPTLVMFFGVVGIQIFVEGTILGILFISLIGVVIYIVVTLCINREIRCELISKIKLNNYNMISKNSL